MSNQTIEPIEIPITKPEHEQRQAAMFGDGWQLEVLRKWVSDARSKGVKPTQLAVATLADVQELIARGRMEDARQVINRVKWLVEKFTVSWEPGIMQQLVRSGNGEPDLWCDGEGRASWDDGQRITTGELERLAPDERAVLEDVLARNGLTVLQAPAKDDETAKSERRAHLESEIRRAEQLATALLPHVEEGNAIGQRSGMTGRGFRYLIHPAPSERLIACTPAADVIARLVNPKMFEQQASELLDLAMALHGSLQRLLKDDRRHRQRRELGGSAFWRALDAGGMYRMLLEREAQP